MEKLIQQRLKEKNIELNLRQCKEQFNLWIEEYYKKNCISCCANLLMKWEIKELKKDEKEFNKFELTDKIFDEKDGEFISLAELLKKLQRFYIKKKNFYLKKEKEIYFSRDVSSVMESILDGVEENLTTSKVYYLSFLPSSGLFRFDNPIRIQYHDRKYPVKNLEFSTFDRSHSTHNKSYQEDILPVLKLFAENKRIPLDQILHSISIKNDFFGEGNCLR